MLTRIATGVLLTAVCAAIFGFLRNPVVTGIVLYAFVAVAGAEFLAMRWGEKTESEAPTPTFTLAAALFGISYGVPLVLGVYFASDNEYSAVFWSGTVAFALFFALVSAVFLFFKSPSLEKALENWISYVAGFVYIAFPSVLILLLALSDAGDYLFATPFWFAVAVVYMGDTGAYFSGVTLGKRKLIPAVSPKKTWEGSVGGLVWSAVTAALLNAFWNFDMPLWAAVLTGLALGISGQIGDLVESALKRIAGCKDSGRMFPGHGGVLDRIDSLLFAAPICFAILSAFQVI
jgi:phosphatidate cytidylyltransferase